MILGFSDTATEDIYNGAATPKARGILKELWPVIRRKLDQLNRATSLNDLRVPPNNRLMKFGKGHKIRVNDQYRITFKFEGGSASEVLVSDTH